MARAAQPILLVTGPTASGKSAWVERLAEELPLEIVSVDSALVYRGMDIGTAKPDRTVRARIPHHLIDIRDPAESYSAGEFVKDAVVRVREIHDRGRLPVLTGGTMLYVRALLHGIAELPAASPEIRREIDERAAIDGWPALHTELARVDPDAAARIRPSDPQRIQRALEVYRQTGTPLSHLQRRTHSAFPDEAIDRWALVPQDRATLHARIDYRFRRMLEQGILGEVARLHARPGLTPRHPAIRAVGYRQLWAHLAGECSLDEAVAQAVAATRQLAKRQLTWIRADATLRRIDPEAPGAYAIWRDAVRRSVAGVACR